MSVTILEALESADYNLKTAGHPIQTEIGINQLHNAVTLLVKGYDLHETIDPLLEKYPNIEDAPDMEN